MNAIPFQWVVAAAVVVVALLSLEEWLLFQRKKPSARLRGREYGRTFGDLGPRTEADAELGAGGERVGYQRRGELPGGAGDRGAQ